MTDELYARRTGRFSLVIDTLERDVRPAVTSVCKSQLVAGRVFLFGVIVL